MTLMREGKPLKTYKVALSRQAIGPKERVGDHKVPEGEYVVDSKNPQSRFDRALHISYPNAADRERAQKLGVDPGGNVEIHGVGRAFSWVGSLETRETRGQTGRFLIFYPNYGAAGTYCRS